MCTVTFVPFKNGALIASNRDEKNIRKPALQPTAYMHGAAEIYYPKDTQAGGTWIAFKRNGDAAVLLNGAFKKHTANPPYLKSRGIVLLHIFENKRPVQTFLEMQLKGIEPFTLILFIEQVLAECRWDGNIKHIKYLPVTQPHIWSSATLYSADVIAKREDWFKKWLAGQNDISAHGLYYFHQFGGDGDERNDLVMQRENVYKTVSITVLDLQPGKCHFNYYDLIHQQALAAANDSIFTPATQPYEIF